MLVTGGRDYDDRKFVFTTLDLLHTEWKPFTLLIHGDAPGADTLADEWALSRAVTRKPYPADWLDLTAPGAVVKQGKRGPYNSRAGSQRNQKMLDEGQPDVVIAFPGGIGTADMVRRAQKAGVHIVRCGGERPL